MGQESPLFRLNCANFGWVQASSDPPVASLVQNELRVTHNGIDVPFIRRTLIIDDGRGGSSHFLAQREVDCFHYCESSDDKVGRIIIAR